MAAEVYYTSRISAEIKKASSYVVQSKTDVTSLREFYDAFEDEYGRLLPEELKAEAYKLMYDISRSVDEYQRDVVAVSICPIFRMFGKGYEKYAEKLLEGINSQQGEYWPLDKEYTLKAIEEAKRKKQEAKARLHQAN